MCLGRSRIRRASGHWRWRGRRPDWPRHLIPVVIPVPGGRVWGPERRVASAAEAHIPMHVGAKRGVSRPGASCWHVAQIAQIAHVSVVPVLGAHAPVPSLPSADQSGARRCGTPHRGHTPGPSRASHATREFRIPAPPVRVPPHHSVRPATLSPSAPVRTMSPHYVTTMSPHRPRGCDRSSSCPTRSPRRIICSWDWRRSLCSDTLTPQGHTARSHRPHGCFAPCLDSPLDSPDPREQVRASV